MVKNMYYLLVNRFILVCHLMDCFLSLFFSGPSNPEILKKKNKNVEGGFDETPVVRVKQCGDLVKRYVARQNVTKPTGILHFEITAFSYFFDRTTEVGLVGW